MKSKIWGVVAVVALTLAGCAREVPLGLKAENLISRAAWTVKTFRASGEDTMKRFQGSLETAKAVAVFPALVKAGFIVGAEVGHGVLVARGADGSWGQPAFYTLGAGSVGLQIGGQVAETVLVIRSDDALKAVIEHQLKLGGDISVVGGIDHGQRRRRRCGLFPRRRGLRRGVGGRRRDGPAHRYERGLLRCGGDAGKHHPRG